MKQKRFLPIALIAGFLLTSISLTNPATAEPKGQGIGFWSKDRLANALAISVVVDEKTGKASVLKEVRGGGKPSNSNTSGSAWLSGGDPLAGVGKIFFKSGTGLYVCSGAWIEDSHAYQSLILTAGHCAYDYANGFSTEMIFIPNYKSGESCNDGLTCYEVTSLYVHEEFKDAPEFNTQALKNDWAFGVVDDYDSTPAFAIEFQAEDAGIYSSSFGYPAAKRYNGSVLINCFNPISLDANTDESTYGMGCNMTGGASGGPWFKDGYTVANPTQIGTIFSLNSYKYTRESNRMYGPIFNERTQATYDSADSGTPATGVSKS